MKYVVYFIGLGEETSTYLDSHLDRPIKDLACTTWTKWGEKRRNRSASELDAVEMQMQSHLTNDALGCTSVLKRFRQQG